MTWFVVVLMLAVGTVTTLQKLPLRATLRLGPSSTPEALLGALVGSERATSEFIALLESRPMDEALIIIADTTKTRLATVTYVARYLTWPRTLVVVDCRAAPKATSLPRGLVVVFRDGGSALPDHVPARSLTPSIAVLTMTGDEANGSWC